MNGYWGKVASSTTGQVPAGSSVYVYEDGDGLYVVSPQGAPLLHLAPTYEQTSSIEEVTERKTPGWAVVVGILGLLVFLIGILFFFVKTDVRTKVTMRRYTVEGREVLAVQQSDGSTRPPAALVA